MSANGDMVTRFLAGELGWDTVIRCWVTEATHYSPTDPQDHIAWATRTISRLKLLEESAPDFADDIRALREKVERFGAMVERGTAPSPTQ